MGSTPRQRFLDYVRRVPGARPIVSPFLPKPKVVEATLRHLHLPVTADAIANEVHLSHALDYEPMFMTDCPGLLFPWKEDPGRSDDQYVVSVLSTPGGEWTRRVSRALGQWGGDADVIETIAPPPEGDNDLAEARQHLDASICSKGNLSLRTLRDGGPEDVRAETQRAVDAVRGYAHIFSTADAVLPGTPPENLIAFIRTAREGSPNPPLP